MSEQAYLADRQAIWSTTANYCKAQVDKARTASFYLSVIGAALAAASTQFTGARLILAIGGSLCLTVAAFLTARVVNRERISRHVRARAASEALKREAFLYATGTGGYSDVATRAEKLSESQARIEDEIDDLTRYEKPAPKPGSCPRASLDLNGYLAQRLRKQIRYYRDNADTYATSADRLRRVEVGLAFVAVTGRCECSTSRMISSFSDARYLMPAPPHPRSCFF